MKLIVTSASTLLSASLIVLSSTGCVTTSSAVARFDDRTDPCYVQRQPLIQTEQQLGRKMVAGALIGGLGAAGVAAATGADGDKVLISALVGAIAGATAGYYQGMSQKKLTQEQMISEIYGDASVDARRVSQTRGLIGSLNECRNRQIDQVETEYRAGRINKEEVVRRVNVIKVATDADNELIGTVLGHANQRSTTYVDAATRASGLGEDAVLGDVKSFDPVFVADTSVVPTPLLPAKQYVATSSSNVRSAPSTSAQVVGGLKTGQKIGVTGIEGDWLKIAFNDQTAFVHNSLLAQEDSVAARTAIASARQTRQLESQSQVAAAVPPKPKNSVQEVVFESRMAEAEASADKQKIASRLNDLMLLGGQAAS